MIGPFVMKELTFSFVSELLPKTVGSVNTWIMQQNLYVLRIEICYWRKRAILVFVKPLNIRSFMNLHHVTSNNSKKLLTTDTFHWLELITVVLSLLNNPSFFYYFRKSVISENPKFLVYSWPLKVRSLWCQSGFFISNFEYISHLFLVLLLTLSM